MLRINPQVLDLLAYLLSRPQQLCSRQEIIDEIWGGRVVSEGVLSVTVSKLRQALGEVASTRGLIESHYGRGYVLTSVVSEVPDTLRTNEPRVPTICTAPRGEILVGREHCLQQLEDTLRLSDTCGGGIVAIIGGPGIGKTRLAEAFRRTASSHGAVTAWTRFRAEGRVPLLPFSEILDELGPSELSTELRALIQLWTMRAHDKKGGHSCADLVDASYNNQHRLERIADELCELRPSRRLVIVLEDLHWADSASLMVLALIANKLKRRPMMIVVTLRLLETQVEAERHRELMHLLRHSSCQRIQLGPLNESDVQTYVDELFGSGPLDLVDAVYERSDGNPLQMVELLRPWTIGRVERPTPEQLVLPTIVYDAAHSKLSLLPEKVNQILAAASVLGHEFDLGLLSFLTHCRALDLLDAMDAAMNSAIVVPSSDVMTTYSFCHASMREALYTSLNMTVRRRLHLGAADALRTRKAAGQPTNDAALARHSLAALPEGDLNQAIALAKAAARRCSQAGRYGEARSLLRSALEALQPGVDDQELTHAWLRIELAVVERMMGYSSYLDHLARGVALARSQALGTLLLKAGCLLSPVPGFHTHKAASELLEAALEALPEADHKNRSIAHAHLARTPPHCRSARHVDQLLTRAEQLCAQAGDPVARATVNHARLFVLTGPATQRFAEALADDIDRDNAAAAVTRQCPTHTTAPARMSMAMQRGDLLAFQQALETCSRELSELHNPELDWHLARFHTIQKMNRAEYHRVADTLVALRKRATQLRLEVGPSLFALDYETLQLWTNGNVARSKRKASTNISLPSDSLQTAAHKLRSMLDAGFIDEARAITATIDLDALSDIPMNIDYLVVLVHYAAASVATHNSELCSALYDMLTPYVNYHAIGTSFHAYGSVAQALGSLASELRQPSAALEHFEYAELRHRELGWIGWMARSQFEQARVLLSVGTPETTGRAVTLLHNARRVAKRSGLKPLVSMIGRLL